MTDEWVCGTCEYCTPLEDENYPMANYKCHHGKKYDKLIHYFNEKACDEWEAKYD